MNRRRAYDDAVALPLPWLGVSVAVLFCAYGAVYPQIVAGVDGWVLGVMCWVISAVAFGLSVLGRTNRLPARLAHPAVSVVLALLLVLSVAHLWLTEDARQTTDLMLLAVAAGAVLVDRTWVVLSLVAVWAGFIASLFVVPAPVEGWGAWVMGMCTATFIAVVVSVTRRRNVEALARAAEIAEQAAVRDPLTGLANRRGLVLLAGPVLEGARRTGDAVHCLFLDVDGFKKVNDNLGHQAGDEVLLAVAEALIAVTRGTDVVARWGGDEFCIVGPGAGQPPVELERRVREHVQRVPPVPGEVWPAEVSAGAAMLTPWDEGSLTDLLNAADQEMYRRRALRRTTRHRVVPIVESSRTPPIEH